MRALPYAIVSCVTAGALAVGSPAAAGTDPSARVWTPDIPERLPDTFVVLPFANASGVRSLEWMRVGLPVALAEKLESHPGLRAAYEEDTLVAPGGQDVVQAARAARARYVFAGSFRRPSWKLEIHLELWSVDGDGKSLVAERTERGEPSSVFGLLDRALEELCAAAGNPVPDAVAERVARAPTRSFYAFTLYGRGMLSLVGLDRRPDAARARKHLGRSVFIDPSYAEAHRMLALAYLRLGEQGKARGQLSYALDLRDDYYAPLALLVRAAHESNDRGGGIDLAVKALSMRPWDLEVRYLLGALLWEDGDAEGARQELERLTRVEPDHLRARRILVLVNAAQGRMDGLAGELEAILRLDPEDTRARLDLGAAYLALGDDDRARRVYEDLVARDPSHLQALKLLGDLHRRKGDLETAIAYYERALAVDRDDPRAYFLLGSAFVQAGQEDRALEIYRAAARFPRYLAEAYSNLGALYYRRGDDARALAFLKSAAQQRPRNPRIHYTYGRALSRARQPERALAEMATATELDPDQADFQFALGVARLRLGLLDEAEGAFQEAVRLDPLHAHAQHNLRLIAELRRRAREGEIVLE